MDGRQNKTAILSSAIRAAGTPGGVALGLFIMCWWLPVLETQQGEILIGFDGAQLAHQEFWKLITEGRTVNSVADIIAIVFLSIGWLANELFLLSLVVLRKWPRVAVRFFAFTLGVMVSWQIAFLEEFPLGIGYWAWVASGAIMLGVATGRAKQGTESPRTGFLGEPITVGLLIIPLLNATAGLGLGAW